MTAKEGHANDEIKELMVNANGVDDQKWEGTFDKDTGGADHTESLATNELYAHVLNSYTDSDLREALNVSRLGGAPSWCSTYKEVQIHGPVCLASDIQALSVPGHAATAGSSLSSTVMLFQKITGCNVLWQGDLLDY